jgi:FlaA1/EpsC-like NDP-sugar epimerase
MNVANLAREFGVETFVLISTDKAVHPCSVMGASKRQAELYVRSLQAQDGNRTRFIITRFGNVLESNGSVLPIFKHQIAKGGPVTVTHPEAVRYFMTLGEACDLVLEAVSVGKGGDIFVFEMGQPVSILRLAEQTIEAAGLKPYRDIDIQFIGLRPGERLQEYLWSEDESAERLPDSKLIRITPPALKPEEIPVAASPRNSK